MNEMPDTILFYPKVGDEAYAIPYMPLSVLSVGSAAEQKGFKVKIIDIRVDLDWQEKVKSLISSKLLCFGISSMTGPQLESAIKIVEFLRKLEISIPIVWGGVHCSLLPEQTLESGLADILVIREGEETFPKLLTVLQKQEDLASLQGIAYKNADGEIFCNSLNKFCNLDDYSVLNYDLLDLAKYQRQGHERIPRNNSISLYTSRGCTFKCTYCYNNSFHDCMWRGQTSEKSIHNFVKLYKEKSIKNFILCDEYFFQDLKRSREICNSIIENNMNVRFFSVNCRLDQIKKMSYEDLKLFSSAGIKDLFIGIESGSDKELKRIKKGIDLNYIEEACERLNKHGINIQFSFMLGLPDETIYDIKKTVCLMSWILRKFPKFCVPSPGKFIPFPGTESYQRAIDCGWKPPKNIWEWSKIVSSINCSEWLGVKMGKIVHQCSFFASAMDTKINPRSNKILEFLRILYSKIARIRGKYGLVKFVPEYMVFNSPLKTLLTKKR